MDFLSVEDREQILPHIIEKVEDKVKQLQESYDELKNLRERERIDYGECSLILLGQRTNCLPQYFLF
jgi:hypothetical protein